MHFTSRVSERWASPPPTPAMVLGANHPLVHDLERLGVAMKQLVVVAAVCAGTLAAWLDGSSTALSIVAGAAVVDLVLAARVALLLQSRRFHVLELVSEGRADLPIAAVERMCRQLRRARHRQQLARSVEALLAANVQRWDLVMIPWRFQGADVIAPIRHQLVEISALLRDESAGAPGIALMELLLTDGMSSLHRDDPRKLHEDLGRVRFLLN